MKLEQETGTLTRDSFHFVAGTSTGTLLAAGIAAGVPARDLRDIYVERMGEVFGPSTVAELRRVLFGWKHRTENLYALVVDELRPAPGRPGGLPRAGRDPFGGSKPSDLCGRSSLCPQYGRAFEVTRPTRAALDINPDPLQPPRR